jgi:UDPglucose--hexose-1-phosphate uridylyltransferase
MTNNIFADADSTIRQDPISKEWVIYSPSRRKRPHDWKTPSSIEINLPFDKTCPFCPGNEEMLSTIIDEIKNRHQNGWASRTIQNKYPALSLNIKSGRSREGMYLHMNGYGHHEVVIENPHHSNDIPQYSSDEYGSVIEMYHKRYNELMSDPQIEMVTIFRNHGVKAGTSLAHPHSQIIGSPTVPRHIRINEQMAQVYFDDYGTCIYCDLTKCELQSKLRLVFQNSSFVAFVPYAAKVPFETWILPRRHTPVFGEISEIEKEDLAFALKDCISRLFHVLNNPDYNYIIHSFTKFRIHERHLHWFVQIIPRLNTPAGFEMGSGFSINPSIPEDDAALLRKF